MEKCLICDQLRAEVERLKVEVDLHMEVDYGSRKWKEAQAEIERLKSRLSNT